MPQSLLAALLKTASLTEHIQDEQGIVRGTLLHAIEAFSLRCAAFFPAESFPGAQRSALRTGPANERELPLPSELPYSLELSLHNHPLHLGNSLDPIFALGPLRELPPAVTTCASVWVLVGDATHHFGTLAFLDESARYFDEHEVHAMRLFGQMCANMLHAVHSRRAAESAHPPETHSSARFAAGSAELIDPLTAVLGYVELLKAEKLDARCRHYVAKLEQQTERAQKKLAELSSSLYGASCTLPPLIPKRPAPANPTDSAVTAARQIVSSVAAAQKKAPAPACRILVCQPNPAVLEFERSVFQALGAEVIATRSAEEAKSWIETQELTGLVLDYDGEDDVATRQLMTWLGEARPKLAARMLVTVSARAAGDLGNESNVLKLAKPLQMDALYLSAQRLLGLEHPGSELVH